MEEKLQLRPPRQVKGRLLSQEKQQWVKQVARLPRSNINCHQSSGSS